MADRRPALPEVPRSDRWVLVVFALFAAIAVVGMAVAVLSILG
jgi:hypothetical protein